MASAGLLWTVVMLRMITLLTLASSVVVMALNNFTDDDGSKVNFTDILAYRYVLACGAVGLVYTLFQIPFAIYNLAQGKRLIANGCLQEFDFFADEAIALLLATGVGVGFGLTFELKRGFADSIDSKAKKYLDQANISTALLLVAVYFMAILLVFSSNRRSSSAKMRFFK